MTATILVFSSVARIFHVTEGENAFYEMTFLVCPSTKLETGGWDQANVLLFVVCS